MTVAHHRRRHIVPATTIGDLTDWSDQPDMVEGRSHARGILLWTSDDKKSESGLSVCTPGTWRLSLPGDELCHFISGRATYTSDDGGLAGRQVEGQGAAMLVAYGMDLGVASALCAADGLSRSPPFAPPAQRCALTGVLSTELSSGVPAKAAVGSLNRYCRTTLCDHRL